MACPHFTKALFSPAQIGLRAIAIGLAPDRATACGIYPIDRHSKKPRAGSHKILKAGYKAEEVRLRTAERLVNLVAIFCIFSWRVMTMVTRSVPEASPRMALNSTELYLLD